MKTVNITWLKNQTPAPSLAYCSEKYQYYFCPTHIETPYDGYGKMVKARKKYIINCLKKIEPLEEE